MKDAFGITDVIELEPLDPNAEGYNLTNAHVDLQVRTLPGNKVIVSSVPADDPQHAILEGNAQKLTDAGFTVIRIMNAPQGDTQAFKTYANALFLNNTIVIPGYNDPAKDAAARQAYDQALNDALPNDDPKRKKIVPLDASQVIQGCGAARCAAREISRSPSAEKAKKASSETPQVSFDAVTGTLSFTEDVINFLGSPDDEVTDPSFVNDFLLGATIEIGEMILDPNMSADNRFAFVGGDLRLHKNDVDLLTATIPVFSIYELVPDGALDMWGILNNVVTAPTGTSAWLEAFEDEVLNSPPLLPDFFISSSTSLIELSQDFSVSFSDVQLDQVGISGNGTPPSVFEPTSTSSLLALGILGAGSTLKRKQKPSKSTDKETERIY